MGIPIIPWDGLGIQIDDELAGKQSNPNSKPKVASQEQEQNKNPTSTKNADTISTE